MEIVLIGLNHRTATVALRERVAFSVEQALEAAEQLRSRGILEETLVLSTCNRSELYGVPRELATDSAGAVELFLASFHQLSPSELNGSLYRHRDSHAVRHLFRVAAGLDSMLLGEDEILGQVRDAYKIALDQGATGPVLNRIFQGALEVGKRVRSETEIGKRPVSVAFAGVKLAERIFGKLNSHRALIIGAGATSEQVVKHLCDRGIKKLRVLNRTAEHAVDLAARFGGEVVPWQDMKAALEWPDLIVTSVSSNEPILSRAILERAMSARGNRALLLIDLGVPRNVSADAADLYNTYLYNIDDLTEIVEQNKKTREAEIPRAEAIIEEQIEKFLHWQAGVATGAVLGDLRAKLGAEREAFLRERLSEMPQLSEQDKAQVSTLLTEFLDRVVLNPAERMRGIPDLRRKIQNLEALRDLFRLDRGEALTPLRIGTRGSALALWQAKSIAEALRQIAGVETELVIIKTSGDKFQQTSFSQIGTKGIFIKELEDALLERRIDLAVHSMKDVPTEIPDGLTIAAVCKREDVRDALLSTTGATLDQLPSHARVGTSSLRRQSQLLHARSDLQMLELRGNVDTRIEKLKRGDYDAIVLAKAGLDRLGLSANITQVLPTELSLPAAGQGAIGIESRMDDGETLQAVSTLNDAETRNAIEAERAALGALEGGCQVSIGAWGRIEAGKLVLDVAVLSPDGAQRLWEQGSGAPHEAKAIGMKVARALLDKGAAALLARESRGTRA